MPRLLIVLMTAFTLMNYGSVTGRFTSAKIVMNRLIELELHKKTCGFERNLILQQKSPWQLLSYNLHTLMYN